MRIKILLFAAGFGLAWPMGAGRADDYPTNMDLQAAYCGGLNEERLQEWSEAPDVPAKQTGQAVNDQSNKHIAAYLLSRGYGRDKDLLLLMLPQSQGRTDARAISQASSGCVKKCPFPNLQGAKFDANGNLDAKTSKALFDHESCFDTCMNFLTDNKWARATACQQLEQSLPF